MDSGIWPLLSVVSSSFKVTSNFCDLRSMNYFSCVVTVTIEANTTLQIVRTNMMIAIDWGSLLQSSWSLDSLLKEPATAPLKMCHVRLAILTVCLWCWTYRILDKPSYFKWLWAIHSHVSSFAQGYFEQLFFFSLTCSGIWRWNIFSRLLL